MSRFLYLFQHAAARVLAGTRDSLPVDPDSNSAPHTQS